MFYLLAELKCPTRKFIGIRVLINLGKVPEASVIRTFLRSADMMRIEMEGRSRDGEIAVRRVTDLRLVFRDIIRGSPVS